MDEDTRLTALNEGAERVRVAGAIIAGLLIAIAISVTVVYLALVLVARHIYGAEGSD